MTVWNKIRFWTRRAQMEQDLKTEMGAHREMLEERFRAEGMDATQAGEAAALKFGNSTLSLENCREEWGFRWFDAILRDLRFALRLIQRQRAIVLAAVLSVALGVGANTAVVSVLQALLLNPMGISGADRIAVATVRLEKLNMPRAETSAVEWKELRDMKDAFAHVAAMEGRYWTSDFGGEPVRVVGRSVTASFFDVFSVRPALGRFFNSDDREAIVLSWSVWSSEFGADASVLGKTLLLDGVPHTIVGVAPENFRYPVQARIWTPLSFTPERLFRRGYNMTLTVVALLKPGVSFAQASDRVSGHVAALKSEAYREGKLFGYFIDLHSFTSFVGGELTRTLWILWAAAIIVLFTGCASVAALLLSRTAGRRREMAIRVAIGATRFQIIRQLTIESVLLGLLGGLAGIALAVGALSFLGQVAIPRRELLSLANMNMPLVVYGLTLSLLCGLIFGIAPGLQLLRDDQVSAMSRMRRHRFQSAFVVAEVAAALVLLISTTLLMRSFSTAAEIHPGFNADGVTTAFVLKPKNDPSFVQRADFALRSVTANSSALAYPLPFAGGGLTSGFTILGRERQTGEPEWHGEAYFVSPSYFGVLQIPLIHGRMFADSDTETAPRVCIIDSRLAERFFPGQDPLGQRIGMYGGPATIVGVVQAIRGTTLETASRPTVYYPMVQVPYFASVGVLVRSTANAASLIREGFRRAGRPVAVFDTQTLRHRIDESIGMRRVVALLVLTFAGICVFVATVGLHGVIGQVVNERVPEIAIRLALGSSRWQIMNRFLASGLRSAAVGIAMGLFFFALLHRWLSGLLFGIAPFDVGALSFACGLILVILVLATALPAWKASRTQPERVLRYQ